MKPSHEQVANLLQNVVGDAPYVTRLDIIVGGMNLVHIGIAAPAYRINKELDANIGFPILLALMKQYKTLILFRSVNPVSFQDVLNNGIDRNPFYASDSFEKVLEYGGDYPLVLVLDASKVESSFRTIYPDAERHAEKLAEARLEFNSPGTFDDATGHWRFSHFPEADRSRLTGYEIAYGKRLTGEPRDGLLALLQFERVNSPG
jgi:hypothetical protein